MTKNNAEEELYFPSTGSIPTKIDHIYGRKIIRNHTKVRKNVPKKIMWTFCLLHQPQTIVTSQQLQNQNFQKLILPSKKIFAISSRQIDLTL